MSQNRTHGTRDTPYSQYIVLSNDIRMNSSALCDPLLHALVAICGLSLYIEEGRPKLCADLLFEECESDSKKNKAIARGHHLILQCD